jgi:hypothetical protein
MVRFVIRRLLSQFIGSVRGRSEVSHGTQQLPRLRACIASTICSNSSVFRLPKVVVEDLSGKTRINTGLEVTLDHPDAKRGAAIRWGHHNLFPVPNSTNHLSTALFRWHFCPACHPCHGPDSHEGAANMQAHSPQPPSWTPSLHSGLLRWRQCAPSSRFTSPERIKKAHSPSPGATSFEKMGTIKILHRSISVSPCMQTIVSGLGI